MRTPRISAVLVDLLLVVALAETVAMATIAIGRRTATIVDTALAAAELAQLIDMSRSGAAMSVDGDAAGIRVTSEEASHQFGHLLLVESQQHGPGHHRWRVRAGSVSVDIVLSPGPR